MEEHIFEFRVLLIQLFNQLSDDHREEFHFIVGSVVPRKLRDDCTPAGTLHLLEFLFDRTLISNHHFDYLIHVFREIGFHDAVERLEEFQRCQNHKPRTVSFTSTEATMLGESVSHIELDKLTNISIDVSREKSCSFSTSEKSSPHTDCTSLLSKTIVSSESACLKKSYVLHTEKRNQSLLNIRKMLKAQFTILTILLLLTNILSILFFTLFYASQCRQPCYSSAGQLISKETAYIEKVGFWHGIKGKFIGSQSFNDAKDLMLSNTDRCTGVDVYWINNYLAFIQFFYSNNRSSMLQRPSSSSELNRVPPSFNRFTLNANEEISKVIFYERVHRTYTNSSLKNFQKKYVVVGVQIRTTDGRKSDPFGSDDGNFTAESFAGYRFQYAKGQHDDRGIEMFQLVWAKPAYRTQTMNEPLLYELDTCSFNYTSEMGNKLRRATGVESSWHDLRHRFGRSEESCRPGAIYYRTISVEGPFLFAVVGTNYVFYHDAGKWTQYKSANSVTFGVIHSSSLHPERASSESP